MLSFQSSESPANVALARSRSTIASSAPISSAPDSCSTSQLFPSQSAKLTLVSDKKDFLALQHTTQKIISGSELGTKFEKRKDQWNDYAANRLLGPGEQIRSFRKRHVANNEDNHVA